MPPEIDSLIGRTLMVGVRGSRPGDDALERDLDACAGAHVGGVILLDRDLPTGGARNIESPGQLADFIGYLRTRLGRSLVVAVDQEGGRVARLRPDRGFRASLTAKSFGALEPPRRRDEARAEAEQLRALGIDLNLAPCVDLALGCPVIDGLQRAYSRDPGHVVACARDVLEAHCAARVGACIKHYPGHGGAGADTHLGPVDITATHTERELEPFRVLAPLAPAVLVAHVLDRRIDADNPASLSPAQLGRLRGPVGFQGAVVADSIDMDAIAFTLPVGDASVRALRAGVDLVIHAVNRPGRITDCPAPGMARSIRRAVEDGTLPIERVVEAATHVDQLARVSSPLSG